MALIRKQVTCPYCEATINLGDCPIVATNREHEAGQFGAEFDAGEPAGGAALASASGHYPVLWRPDPHPPAPPPAPAKSRFMRLIDTLASAAAEDEPDTFEQVPAVSSLNFPWRDLPARACLRCNTPLPDEIGDREIRKIGIVGTTGAGKSHFLAALIKEADQHQALRQWGIADFQLVETSSEMYRRQYESFWHDGRVLDPTKPADAWEVVFRPLIARVTFMLGTQALLYFYDIDGETLVSRGLRARHASYLRRPSGLIFLIDPMMMDSIRKRLPPEESGYQSYIRQGDLVKACVADLAPDIAAKTPIAVTLSKSDLVVAAAKRDYPFAFASPAAADDPIDARAAELAQIDREVREVLGAAGERDLLAVADRLGPGAPVTFHAVAPIGHQPRGHPDGTRLAAEIEPLRCLDPLIALLSPWVRDQILARP